jgi:hypothetical protein
MKAINIIPVALVGAIMMPAVALAAIGVDGLTAEKLGIPPENFVTPDEAKDRAVRFFNHKWTSGEQTFPENVIVFPWIIEDWNNYEPEIYMGYYEITVYSGPRRDIDYDATVRAIEEYVEPLIGYVILENGILKLPSGLVDTENLTRRVFGESEVMVCRIPVNKVYGSGIDRFFGTAISINPVMVYAGKLLLENRYHLSGVAYENTIRFGYLEEFIVYRTNEGAAYLQIGDKDNIYRIFMEERDFIDYFDSKRGLIDSNELRDVPSSIPSGALDAYPGESDSQDELPSVDTHLNTYVPEMTQGEYTVHGGPGRRAVFYRHPARPI